MKRKLFIVLPFILMMSLFLMAATGVVFAAEDADGDDAVSGYASPSGAETEILAEEVPLGPGVGFLDDGVAAYAEAPSFIWTIVVAVVIGVICRVLFSFRRPRHARGKVGN